MTPNAGTELVKSDVVILGGGLSGLAAALSLKERGKKVVVLEKRDRLGGRSNTHEDEELGPIDFGAAFIGASQRYVSHYVTRFGVETFPTFLPTDMTWAYQDGAANVAHLAPGTLPDDLATKTALFELDELAFLVRPYADRPEDLPPWLTAFDAITIDEWEPSAPMSAATREAFYASLRAVLSIEPREASFLFLLHYAATAGGYSRLVDAAGSGNGAEDLRFAKGTGALVAGFADAIGAPSIVTGAKALRVESGHRFVDVHTSDGKVYRGGQLIAAVGPWAFRTRPGHNVPMTLELEFRGPSAEAERHAWNERKRLCDGTHHGLSIKCFLRFEKAFWRDQGRSGRSLCASAEGQPISWTIDNSFPSNLPDSTPLGLSSPPPTQRSLMAFIAGDQAHALAEQSADERRNAVVAQLGELFGENGVLPEVLHYQDHVMAGPAGVMERGILASSGSALRRPIGRVHWASTESALDWCGYMDGAIQSGLRAATEVP